MSPPPNPIYDNAMPTDYFFEKQTMLNSALEMLNSELRFWEEQGGEVNRDPQFVRALRNISLAAESIYIEADKWISIIERSQRNTATQTHTRTRRGGTQ